MTKDLFVTTLVLTKTWNNLTQPETTYKNLKRPTTSKKRIETTYNKQEITWNDPQRVRLNLHWSELTKKEQNKMQNHQQEADFEIILQYLL